MKRNQSLIKSPFCRKSLLSIVLMFLFASGATGQEPESSNNENRPNILLITADDLGVQLSSYGMNQINTPHLDRLARSGVRFSNGYVTQASCSPSRSSIFTGLYPHQTGQVGLSHRGYQMHEGFPTLPSVLGNAGYHTGVIGKIHVRPEKAVPFDFTGPGPGKTRDVRHVANVSEQFLKKRTEKPFFLMVNYTDPHKPYKRQVKGIPADPVSADEVQSFPFLGIDTPDVRESVAGFLNSVKRVDEGIGKLLEAVRSTGHLEETIVLFVGDHGPPMDRAKTTTYEAGVKVPFIVSWPGVTKPRTVRPELVSTVDIVPTLAEAADVRWPNRVAGKSLLPLLRGKTVEWRDALFTEYTSHVDEHYYPRRAVRMGKYKLIVNVLHEQPNPVTGLSPAMKFFQKEKWKNTPIGKAFARYADPPRIELYNLKNDPSELRNLADSTEYEDVRQHLLERLRAWMRSTNDYLLGDVNHEAVKKGQEIPGRKP